MLAELHADNLNVSCCILSSDVVVFLFSISSKVERMKEGEIPECRFEPVDAPSVSKLCSHSKFLTN